MSSSRPESTGCRAAAAALARSLIHVGLSSSLAGGCRGTVLLPPPLRLQLAAPRCHRHERGHPILVLLQQGVLTLKLGDLGTYVINKQARALLQFSASQTTL